MVHFYAKIGVYDHQKLIHILYFDSTHKELSFGAKFAFQKCCAPTF